MNWSWLKHAFAVEQEDAKPDEGQREAIDRVCREIVRRGLAVPALAFLEMSRPLNYVGAQSLHFFQPFFSVFTDSTAPARFAEFLEKRGATEYLCRRIEHFSAGKEAVGAGNEARRQEDEESKAPDLPP